MDRRIFVMGALIAASGPARAQTVNYRVELVSGGPTLAGAHVRLAPGWKTYWRMPGDAGIPPQFDWSGSVNLAKAEVAYPLPSRFQDGGGETIGYYDEVMFPVTVTPQDASQPVILKLEMAFAVCRDICIPARASSLIDLGSAPPSSLVAMWTARVPVIREKGPILSAHAQLEGTKPALALIIDGTPDDIFIESSSPAYFGKPMAGKGEVLLPISNVKRPEDLHGLALMATLVFGTSGIEQAFTVA